MWGRAARREREGGRGRKMLDYAITRELLPFGGNNFFIFLEGFKYSFDGGSYIYI